MNILFLADPNSIHDIKWMSNFSLKKKYNCFIVIREHHFKMMTNTVKTQLKELNIQIICPLPDFSILRFWTTFITALNLISLLKKHRITIFHIQYAEPNALWAIFKKFFPCKIVLTTRGTDVLKTIPLFFIRKDVLALLIQHLYLKAFNSMDAITSTSLSQQKSIGNLFQPKKNILIRTGIDTDFINEEVKTPAVNIYGEYLFFPRSMTPLYDHELALDAIDLLPADIAKKLTFIFVDSTGNDKAYISKIQDIILHHRLKNQIVFLERLNQKSIITLTKFAKAVIMTPKSDGASVSAMETMFCGTPLILPPLDYDTDLFEGIIQFNERTANDLANTITKVLNGFYSTDKLTLLKNRANLLCNRTNEMQKLEDLFDALQ